MPNIRHAMRTHWPERYTKPCGLLNSRSVTPTVRAAKGSVKHTVISMMLEKCKLIIEDYNKGETENNEISLLGDFPGDVT